MSNRALVLDANILIRAVLGIRVRRILENYAISVNTGRKRGSYRLPDRPILASALALVCPTWTEDTDFSGCGVATWTSSSVEILLGDY